MFDDDFESDNDPYERESAKAEEAGAALPPPRQASECRGHETVERELLNLYNEGRLPHALVFTGLEGIGKSTMAFRLARFLFKNGGGTAAAESSGGLFGDPLPAARFESLAVKEDDPVFRQVAAAGHPDLLTIERPFDEKKGRRQLILPVDEVRKIAPFLRLTSAQTDGWRIVIVDDADSMNRASQNAILKILEEPPPRTILILVAHKAGLLIPTIRSRMRVISFSPPPNNIFSALLRHENPSLSDKDIGLLWSISGGSIGQGLRLAGEGGRAAVAGTVELLLTWPKWNWPGIHNLADNLSKSGQDDSLRAFSEILLWICETLLRAKAQGQEIPSFLPGGKALFLLMEHYSLAGWIEICENLKSHFDTVSHAGLDKKQAVLGAFMIFN